VDDEHAEAVLRHCWSMSSRRYLAATVNGRRVLLHRFVWRLRHGDCPPLLDHINGDKTDCRTSNLRPANSTLNNLNSRKPRRALPPGVYFDGRRVGSKTYQAKGCRDGKCEHLGMFATPEEASAAYESWRSGRIATESEGVQ
jgi:hypothetical protein